MASNVDFTIGSGAKKWKGDPKWLAADESEVPGKDLQSVTWNTSDPRILAGGDADMGDIRIPDLSNFNVGDQVLVTVTGDPAPGDEDPLIILEAIFTAVAEKKTATHGQLDVVEA